MKHGPRVSQSGRLYTKLGGPKLNEAREKAAALRRKRMPRGATLGLMARFRMAGRSYDFIAKELNIRNVRTADGFRWHASTARRVSPPATRRRKPLRGRSRILARSACTV
jgi:hypothetical protein